MCSRPLLWRWRRRRKTPAAAQAVRHPALHNQEHVPPRHRILSKYLPCRQVRISRLIRQNFDTGRRASLTFRQFRGTSTACSRQITQTCSLYHPATNHRVGYHLKYNHCNCNTLFIPQEKSYILFRCTLVIPRQHKDCAMTELKQRTFGTRSLLTMLCSRLQHPHVV